MTVLGQCTQLNKGPLKAFYWIKINILVIFLSSNTIMHLDMSCVENANYV